MNEIGERTQRARGSGGVALNIENDRLTAVVASVAGSRVLVRSWLSADRPQDVDGTDPQSLGRWVGSELKKAGMARVAKLGGLVFAVPRGEVVLKRIAFPPGTSRAELPGMVRLQMVRQLTVSAENAAIDYVPVGSVAPTQGGAGGGGGGGSGGGGASSVLAGALQGDRLDWRKAIARASGGRLRRVALRSAGAAALLAEASQRRGGSTLGIALGSGSTEFVVVEDGQLVFARATDLFRPDRERPEEIEAFAQKVAVEAKRTWMSYRVAPETSEIEAVVVLGADDAAKAVAERCRESLELPSEATDYPPYVEVPAEMTPAERTVMAPLVGLLAEPVIGRATMDFAHPRQAPDMAAMRRQRVLLAALLAIVVGGGGMTWARMDLNRREAKLAALRSRFGDLTPQYAEYLRTRARVEHLDQWMAARVDWLGNLDEVAELLPDPHSGVLDRLDGHSEISLTFDLPKGGSKRFADGKWVRSVDAVFDLAGSVKQREVADALRKKFLDDDGYVVQSVGPDTPGKFDLVLKTKPGAARPNKPAGAKPSAMPRASAAHPDRVASLGPGGGE